MENKIDEILKHLKEKFIEEYSRTPGKPLTDQLYKKYIENHLIAYFTENADEKLLTVESSERKTLIDFALENNLENFLCIVIEKFPKLAEQKDKHGWTFLHKTVSGKVIIKALHTNPKLVEQQDINGWTVLHHAADIEMSDTLIEALKINPKLAEIQNKDGNTFLHLTAYREGRYALEHVTDPKLLFKNNDGKDPFDIYNEISDKKLEKPKQTTDTSILSKRNQDRDKDR